MWRGRVHTFFHFAVLAVGQSWGLGLLAEAGPHYLHYKALWQLLKFRAHCDVLHVASLHYESHTIFLKPIIAYWAWVNWCMQWATTTRLMEIKYRIMAEDMLYFNDWRWEAQDRQILGFYMSDMWVRESAVCINFIIVPENSLNPKLSHFEDIKQRQLMCDVKVWQ